MEYRKMGKTGLQLSTLSFGSWVTFHKQINDGIADTLMGMAYDGGVNFFDNAEVYAAGESEKMMGRVLAKKNGTEQAMYYLPKRILDGEEKRINPIKLD
jgi:aryl-alcohol dehydrogenase-like predicted oxidoreductase